MEDNKKEIIAERIKNEIEKIDGKKNNIYFFVIDTKGNPSGSLEYIYKLAYITKEMGYNVGMLYQVAPEEEFVGVNGWLDEKYSSLPHMSVSSEEINVSPSDILFIPEIFSNVMVQTKKLPCKRIAILQNYDYMVEQMPFSVQWGDLGILECVTNTEVNSELIKDVFPYVKTTIIPPYVDEMFGTTTEPKKMIVNVIAKNQDDINRIVKPFYWKYPVYKWVSFRDVRGLEKKEFAAALREAEVTVWIDEDTSFGYSALEAMKSGNIVISKRTQNEMPWSKTDNKYNDCCLWFDSINDVHKMIASVIRAVITDTVPSEISEDIKKALSVYSSEKTKKAMTDYVEGVVANRRKEIEALLSTE